MFDPILDSRVHAAIGVAGLGGIARQRIVFHVLDELRASPDEYVAVPYRDISLRLGISEGGAYKAVRWLVARRVLLQSDRRAGRGGARLYKVNPVVETWLVPWLRPAPIRRLILDAAETTGRAALNQSFAALMSAALPSDLPRYGVGGAARNGIPLPNCRAPVATARQKTPPSAAPRARQNQEALSRGDRHTNGESTPSLSEGAGRGRFDLSRPGAAVVMNAIRARVGKPNCWLAGGPARALERLLDTHETDALVEAIALAEDGWGPPLIVAELPALLEHAAMPPADLGPIFEPPGMKVHTDDEPPPLPMEEQAARVRALKASRRQNGGVEVSP